VDFTNTSEKQTGFAKNQDNGYLTQKKTWISPIERPRYHKQSVRIAPQVKIWNIKHQ
jgi:hypothetical protein